MTDLHHPRTAGEAVHRDKAMTIGNADGHCGPAQPAQKPVAWQWRSRINGGAWDAWETGRYGQTPPPFMDIEERPLFTAPAAQGVRPLSWIRAALFAWGEYAPAGLIKYHLTWTYRAEPEVWFEVKRYPDCKMIYQGGDEDAAKAAAQADFDRRILSALIPAAQPAQVMQYPEGMR